MKQIAVGVITLLLLACRLSGDDTIQIPLETPQNWAKERIDLPPSFAKNMKLQGVEEIRFAPGMFEPESKAFFSYVIVFNVESQPQVTKEVLQRELLAYYRGLAVAVGRGKQPPIDPDAFTVQLKTTKSPRPKATGYEGDLVWTEPFKTMKKQTLHLEADVWNDAKSNRTVIFISVSPSDKKGEIWSQMRKIRGAFVAK